MGWEAVATAALGGLSSLMGSKKKSQAAMAPIKMARQHYKEGKQRISAPAYQQGANMLAPGLLQGGQSPVGGALVQQALGLLQNPGQIGPQHRERIAEAQNRMMNMLRWAVPGMAQQQGIAPEVGQPGVGGAMYLSGLLNALSQTNEANRQLADMQEALRRQDIGMGGNLYQMLMQMLLQKQLGEAQTLIGAPIPQVQASQAGGAVGGLGNFLGSLLASGKDSVFGSLFK